jgi:hypothetical protein
MALIANPGLFSNLQKAQAGMTYGTKPYMQVKDMLGTAKDSIDLAIKSGQLSNDQYRTFLQAVEVADKTPGFKPLFTQWQQSPFAIPQVSAPQVSGSQPSAPVAVSAPEFSGTPLSRDSLVKQITETYKIEPTALSTTRTREQQQSLFDRWKAGEKNIFMPLNPADYPGRKEFHVNEIDVPTSVPESFMNKNGWYRPFPKDDPVHYEPIGSRGAPARAPSQAAPAQATAAEERPELDKELADQITRIKTLGLDSKQEREAIRAATEEHEKGKRAKEVATTQYEREVMNRVNKEFFESVQKPLGEAVSTGNQAYVANQRALKILDETKVGPGTTLAMQLAKIKEFAFGLSPKEKEEFVRQKSINQAQAEAVASGVKAAFGGNLSNKETDRFIQSLYSINDPKEFIRAALEMQIYAHKLKQDLLSHLTNVDQTKVDKNKTFTDYWSSDKPTELLKKYAPSVAKVVESAPSLEQFLKDARPLNVGVPDEALINWYKQKYGK